MGDPPRSPTPEPAPALAPNFYVILGIPIMASLVDIRKAYKSLVMKWHPDKNPTNKAEAEAKIRSINEAYRVLSTKRREEDTIIINEPKTLENLFYNEKDDDAVPSSPPILSRNSSRRSHTPVPSARNISKSASRRSTRPTPADYYASVSRSSSGSSTPTTPSTPTEPTSLSRITSRRSTTPIIFSQLTARRKPHPNEKKLEWTLEELCNGCVKKIKITRDVISNTGLIVQEEETVHIRVNPGWKKGMKITFEGKGDQKPGTLPADIAFVIDEKRHPVYKRLGDDLELGVEIPLVQALTGCTITVPLLGGENMTLSFDDIIYQGYEKIIPGQGMPKPNEEGRRGDLQLKFHVEFPDELNQDQCSEIVGILKDCS